MAKRLGRKSLSPVAMKSGSLFILLLFYVSVEAQSANKDILNFREAPKSIRPKLAERLKQYIECQRTQQWDKLELLLANFYLSPLERKKIFYTSEERQMILTALREKPMLSFMPQSVRVSTKNFSVPLRQKEWELSGCAEFKEQDKTIRAKAFIHVYCQNRQWIFGPIRMFSDKDGWPLSCAPAFGRIKSR